MLWVPPAQGFGTESAFHDAATVTASPGVTVALPASANTKSSWVEVTAATAGDVIELALVAVGTTSSGNNSATLIDIGTGASGSETVIVADIPAGFTNTTGSGIPGLVRLPVSIPSGTRVAVRAASQRTSANINVPVMFNYGSRHPGIAFPGTEFDTYGAQSASSNGAEVTPNASANTNGSWVQLTASTARDHRGFLLLTQGWGGTAGGAISMNAHGFVLELGAGGSGSEVVLGSVHVRTSTAEVRQGPWPDWPIWRSIPAGTRIAARCRCSNASGVSIDAVAIGIS
jgi:hypothetical protein